MFLAPIKKKVFAIFTLCYLSVAPCVLLTGQNLFLGKPPTKLLWAGEEEIRVLQVIFPHTDKAGLQTEFSTDETSFQGPLAAQKGVGL